MSDVVFREDPQQIAAFAVTVGTQRGSLSTRLENIRQRADDLKQVWKSDSADEYRKQVDSMLSAGEQLVAVMDEFKVKLEQTSGIYTTGEASAKAAAEGLPTDGVYR